MNHGAVTRLYCFAGSGSAQSNVWGYLTPEGNAPSMVRTWSMTGGGLVLSPAISAPSRSRIRGRAEPLTNFNRDGGSSPAPDKQGAGLLFYLYSTSSTRE